jgi:hypothetical protein
MKQVLATVERCRTLRVEAARAAFARSQRESDALALALATRQGQLATRRGQQWAVEARTEQAFLRGQVRGDAVSAVRGANEAICQSLSEAASVALVRQVGAAAAAEQAHAEYLRGERERERVVQLTSLLRRAERLRRERHDDNEADERPAPPWVAGAPCATR